MALTQAIAVGGVQLVKLRLLGRMQALARETGEAAFVMPAALLLLADQAHGGVVTARELAQRFHLADFESRNLIDFYFPGWSAAGGRAATALPGAVPAPPRDDLRFDPRSGEGFRQALRAAGVKPLGGSAELILVDAGYVQGSVRLNFAAAIGLDLAAAAAACAAERPQLASAGALLQALIDTVERLKGRAPGDSRLAFTWSERLGLAVSKKSLVEGLFDEWGATLGSRRLAELAVRDLGPDLPLIDL
jgi:hypothetical protein